MTARFDDQFLAGPLAAFAHERRGGGATGVRLIRSWTPAHGSLDPPTADLVVGLMLGGSGGARWAWDGAKFNEARSRPRGALGLTPPGAEGRFEVAGPSGMLLVALPLAQLRARLAPELAVPNSFGRLHDAYGDHPFARALCLRLWRAAGGGPAHDPLVDALAEALVVEFARLDGVTARAPARPAALGARELRRVLASAEMPDASVEALAAAAAMPVRTFRRRFAATLGSTPHAWLLRLRLARAAAMLGDARDPIAEVAAIAGFASQSHLTTWFTREYGVSPGRYRRDRQRSSPKPGLARSSASRRGR